MNRLHIIDMYQDHFVVNPISSSDELHFQSINEDTDVDVEIVLRRESVEALHEFLTEWLDKA